MKRVLLSWSSGKDSAWSLHVLRQAADYEIVGLLTTLNSQFDRVAMHGTRREILERQARAAELPLWDVPLPWPCSNEAYEGQMRDACARAVLVRSWRSFASPEQALTLIDWRVNSGSCAPSSRNLPSLATVFHGFTVAQ